MPEPRSDMLPNPEPVAEAVRDDVTVPAPASPVIAAEPVTTAAPASGARTPEQNLKAALDEERRMRKEAQERARIAEEKTQELESAAAPSHTIDDDELTPTEKIFKKQLEDQHKELLRLQRERETDRVVASYPELQENREEFETFCIDYPANTGRDKLAKIFLAEKGLLGAPVRKGLESARGGPRETASTTKYTAEEIDRMMKSEPRKFNKLIQSGVLKPEDVPA